MEVLKLLNFNVREVIYNVNGSNKLYLFQIKDKKEIKC